MDRDRPEEKQDRPYRPRPTQEEVDKGVPGVDKVPSENLPPGVTPRERITGTPPTRLNDDPSWNGA
ncbi:hypothetical protein C4556_00070 [Candidatus Parcubacteria bacterium]|nr:MAG: hypothetical protein C4556_00070 [Candidatus Parcubacteria bacterium]